MKKVLLALFVLIVTIVLSGCSQQQNNPTIDNNSAVDTIGCKNCDITMESLAKDFCNKDGIEKVTICDFYTKVYYSDSNKGIDFLDFKRSSLLKEANCPRFETDSTSDDCVILLETKCVEQKIC